MFQTCLLLVAMRSSTSRKVALGEQFSIAAGAATPTWIYNGADNKDDDTPAEGTMMSSPTFKIMDFLFSIPILHDILFGVYRKQIVQKSEKMGLPWTEFMDEQWENLPVLKRKAEAINDPAVTIPEYYYAPIHATAVLTCISEMSQRWFLRSMKTFSLAAAIVNSNCAMETARL